LENIPKGKPVVFAPNHVNAFMDPVLIGMTIKREVRFFARGDVFKGAFSRWILDKLNISPVYRLQEGYGNVKKNDKTFEECKELLSTDQAIMMFPEGICIQERRLRPLKKGLSRIVFQTAASIDFRKDILVIPVGINYTNAKKFRSKAVLDFGKPLSILPYKDAYSADSIKTINEFTRALEAKMKEHLVIIDNPADEKLVAGLEEIYTKEWIKQKAGNANNLNQQYKASAEMAAMVNTLNANHPDLHQSLKSKIEAYIDQLHALGLRDHLLNPDSINKMNVFTTIKDSLMIYIGVPIYALALLFNCLPYYLAKRFSDKNIKNVEFYASVYSNLAMFIWLLFYGIQLLAVALVFRNWSILALYALLIPILGVFALRFKVVMKKILGNWRLLRLVKKEHDTVSKLIDDRKVILEEIRTAKKTANV
jgi:1-acyl-sn-glycerol-3-phosphate acyltransferase/uncharacterized protein with PQ loop repeat